MQDTEEIIFKGLDILGKLMDADESSRRQEKEDAPPAGEPELPEEEMIPQEVEPDHVDHESHWSWSHNSTQTLAASVIGSIAIVSVAYLHYRGKQKPKD